MGDTPPRWQHTYFYRLSEPGTKTKATELNNVLMQAYEEANKLGADGWEMVNFTTQWVDSTLTLTVGDRRTGGCWLITCFMKRGLLGR
jgi:hypothetical protein